MKSQELARRNRALKVAIAGSDFTQRRLAKRMRIDETRLSRIVKGHIEPTDTERERLARLLNKPVVELFPDQVSA